MSQTLYEFLNEQAKERNLSLSMMAQEIGLNHRTLTATSFRKPRLETMAKIARYLNVNLMDLNLMPIRKEDA